MARPLRIEFAGALYHITSRGDGREAIHLDDSDRASFLGVFGEVCNRFNWLCHAYCLMGNHYHLLIEARDGNFGKARGAYGNTIDKAFEGAVNKIRSRDYLLSCIKKMDMDEVFLEKILTVFLLNR